MVNSDKPALYAEDIHKRFAGIDALQGVTLSLRRGEVHTLLGVDGAGKSTLVKILAGVTVPDAGRLYIDDLPVSITTPRVASALGISAMHQEVRLVPSLSVASNILLDYAPVRRLLFLPFIDWRRLRASARQAMDLLEFDIDLEAGAEDLTLEQQQMVKLVKALCTRPRVLLLDEPTYAMEETNTSHLFRAIRTLARNGTSVLYVSSRLDEIPRVADRVSVLKGGKIISTMQADEANLRAVVEMLVAETSQAMALREADRLRREFVSLVSHELRTPLATIRGYAETVMSRTWSEEVQQECLSSIAAGCERLTELVDNLLDVSNMEKGTLRIEKDQVLLSDLARRVVNVNRRRNAGDAHVVVRFPSDFPLVSADPRRIEQVLNNLLDNALKYSLQGGTVTIAGRIEPAGDMVVVSVEDQGMGIPTEHLDRVFERFYRVPIPETAGIEGSGLGLAICKGIIERHGGQISVRSNLGRGSVFSFSLPLDAPPLRMAADKGVG